MVFGFAAGDLWGILGILGAVIEAFVIANFLDKRKKARAGVTS